MMAFFPSKAELGRYVKDHPYASVVIALVAAEAGRTVWASIVNPTGQSPFSSYWSGVKSNPHCHCAGTAGHCTGTGGHCNTHLGNAYSPNYMTRSTLSAMEEDVKSLRNQIDTSAKVPDWAESKIYTAADRINSVDDYMKHRTNLGHVTSEQREKLTKIEGELRKASQMHASQADRISHLGASTSTTTSTSSSHGGTPKAAAPNTWDSHSSPGEKLPMFGGPKTKSTWLRGPPSMRRRVSLNLTRGLGAVGQELHESTEELPVSEHFGYLGMVPESDPEGTDNLYI